MTMGKNAVPVLLEKVDTTTPTNRINIIRAMGIIKDDRFEDILGRIAIDDNDPKQRIEAINALGKYTTPMTKQYIAKVLNDRMPKIKIAALQNIPKDKDLNMVNLIKPLLNDRNKQVVEAAVEAMEKNGNESAVIPLLDRLRIIESDNELRDKIKKAISSLGSTRNLNIILQALDDDLF